MVGHKRERVLGRVGRAIDAAARDLAREAAQLENGGGREAAAERLVEQQVEVVALDKDRVVVETAMRLDVAVAGLVGEAEGLASCLYNILTLGLTVKLVLAEILNVVQVFTPAHAVTVCYCCDCCDCCSAVSKQKMPKKPG